MLKGTVKWFHDNRGWGFLTDENGTDVFVHYSSIQTEDHKTLVEGEQVEYTLKPPGAKGLMADKVFRIAPPAA